MTVSGTSTLHDWTSEVKTVNGYVEVDEKMMKKAKVKSGDVLTIRTDTEEHKGNVLPIQYESFAIDVSVGDTVLIDDGKVECKVIETNNKNRVKIFFDVNS